MEKELQQSWKKLWDPSLKWKHLNSNKKYVVLSATYGIKRKKSLKIDSYTVTVRLLLMYLCMCHFTIDN